MTEYSPKTETYVYHNKERDEIFGQLLKLAWSDNVFDLAEKWLIFDFIEKYDPYSSYNGLFIKTDKEINGKSNNRPKLMLLYMMMLNCCDIKLSKCERLHIKQTAILSNNIEKVFIKNDKKFNWTIIENPENMLSDMIMLAYCDKKLSGDERLHLKEIATLFRINNNQFHRLHILSKQQLYNIILSQVHEIKIRDNIREKFLYDMRRTLDFSKDLVEHKKRFG